LDRLTDAQLAELVADKVPESLGLEYKASPALARSDDKVSELRKDVSALANSDGGRIIYGVVARDGVPAECDEGVDSTAVGPDWLVQVIHSGVRPRLQSIDIYSLPRSSSRVTYVVDVGKSNTAHMANHRYWKRRGSVVMEMEDYEVRDLMRRAEVPDVRVRLVGRPTGPAGERRLALDAAVRNLSSAPAEYFTLTLLFQSGVGSVRADSGDLSYSGPPTSGRRKIRLPEFDDDAREWRWRWWNRMPLFEGEWERIGSIAVDAPYGQHILWNTRAPGMDNRGAYLTTSENSTALKAIDAQWEFAADDQAEG
jgi:hypothetical protein